MSLRSTPPSRFNSNCYSKELALSAQQFAIAQRITEKDTMGNIRMDHRGPGHNNRAVRISASKSKNNKVRRLRRAFDFANKFLYLFQVEFFRPVQVPLHGILRRLIFLWQHAAGLIDRQRKHGAVSPAMF